LVVDLFNITTDTGDAASVASIEIVGVALVLPIAFYTCCDMAGITGFPDTF
jgi:hypothetical protein